MSRNRIAPLSIALEGLPGAGKTTTAALLAAQLPQLSIEVEIVPELVFEVPAEADTSFFLANDCEKACRLRRSAADVAVLDRYWISTAAYGAARACLQPGSQPLPHELAPPIVAHPPPSLWVYLDRAAALSTAFSSDGLWPDPDFRDLYRHCSLELLHGGPSPVIVLEGPPLEVAAELVRWIRSHPGGRAARCS